MPSHMQPQVKNAIGRGLRAILDPELTKKEREKIKEHFENRCAFCGCALSADSRSHRDHLVSTHAGGPNHISNRVLACGSCNGDQKRESDWQGFLREKSDTAATFRKRENKILRWRDDNRGSLTKLTRAQNDLLEHEIKRVKGAFDLAAKRLQRARRPQGE